MNHIAFITPGDASPGFVLAGVTQFTVAASELEGLLKELTEQGTYGLVAVDERLLNPELEELIALLQEAWGGVLVIVPPPPLVTSEGADYAERFLQKAIGYQVRLNI